MTQKRTIKPEDLYELKSVADPQLSSNGSNLAYIETSMLEEKNTYSSNIFYINTSEKSPPVQWTYGDYKDHSPRWSPDGNALAFVSDRSGKPQIYIMNITGGEARQLTQCTNGATNPVWSPDGKKLAFNVSIKPDEEADAADKQEKKNEKPVPLEIDKMKHKSDAQGFWSGRYSQVAVVDIETGKIEQLTSGEHDYQLQSWSPDGKSVAVTADLSEEKDFSFVSDVYLVNPDTKEMKKVTNGKGYFGSATWSPDGKYLGMFGHEREYENATHTKVWVYSLENENIQCLTAESDILAGDYAIGDFQQGVVTPGILWAEDSRSFYFLATDNGNTVVYYGSMDGQLYPALLDQQHVYGLTTGGNINQAVVAISKPSYPGDLYLLDVPTGELEQLTNVNEEFLGKVELADAEPIQFKSSDDWDLHGWIMKPVHLQDGDKAPLVVEIHGGPHAMYANSYFHEFQCLAGKGYAVLFINPRGSHGYGQQFVDAVRGDYGGKDYEDIMDAVDYALKSYSFIDKDRLGVTGGSYGGFMTNWIIGHTNRFKAAVTQRSISNWISFYGVSDIGYYFTDWQIKSDLSNIDKLWKHSPLAYVNEMDTPLLILHSEKDYRCPIEQAEQLFIALKHRKKTAKFVRFPESNHELSRSGKPNLRISRLNYIAGWFDQYL
ncbi:dipeptidyl aminopeptidase/acylaminoacyl peptidase [Cytobacillus oceanisediminis]|uniref:Dipeptidyl aminopeptidase/acylaminoacyl peptidase n=1 Tax=Cytobacillus oceanisediminis TaxID=665099 RepID=A0A2V2ZV01_9BACI|nr:S9 family peptidase [Cytobacillus oceanisediminis]PWW27764.1 dipeptidyl aminopeptidase/acylaminoacyl peptidase [Cytobacillus oceanisediminis]